MQDQPIFRASVRTVPVYATVLDANGRLVPDLTQDDFSVTDNGKPAEIALFSSEPQPFTAVVMMDTSASMTANLKLLNRAAEQFLLRLLPVDRAQVGAFNDKIQLSGTFTNNRDELIAALDDLYFGNPTRLNDAIAASLDALQGVDGRRVMLVFTDGEDTASRIGFGKVLERSRDEEVMVYSIGLESEYFNGVRVVRSKPSRDLRKISEETGGGYFELQKQRRPGADLQPRRDGAAEPVPDCVHSADARWQGAQARRARESSGDDRPGAQELSGRIRPVLAADSRGLDEHYGDQRNREQDADDGFGRRGEVQLIDTGTWCVPPSGLDGGFPRRVPAVRAGRARLRGRPPVTPRSAPGRTPSPTAAGRGSPARHCPRSTPRHRARRPVPLATDTAAECIVPKA